MMMPIIILSRFGFGFLNKKVMLGRTLIFKKYMGMYNKKLRLLLATSTPYFYCLSQAMYVNTYICMLYLNE